MPTLSGHLIIKNGVKYDYPFIESIKSALPMCDEFVVVEGKSEDETWEQLLKLQKQHKKIKLIQADWVKEHYSVLADMTNIAIEACTCDYHYQIQADEAIHQIYYKPIRAAIASGMDFFFLGCCHFFSNFDTVYKEGVFYDKFIRLAKRDTYPRMLSTGDAMGLGTPAYDSSLFTHQDLSDSIKVYHYGYVRKPKALIEKQDMFVKWWGIQELDQYLENGRNNGKIDWLEKHNPDKLESFTCDHPKPMRKWINERKIMVQTGEVK